MKQLFFFITLIIATNSFSQQDRKVSVFFSTQTNKTLYDRTVSNNSFGFGIGLQTIVNTKTFVRPTIEINGYIFSGTKELYLTADDKPIYGKNAVLSIHAGPFIPLSKHVFFATTVGTHFYNNDVHFSARPGLGVFPTKSRKWILRTSFTNVFQRDEISNESFGYLSFAISIKL
jgi:hypothetical protein